MGAVDIYKYIQASECEGVLWNSHQCLWHVMAWPSIEWQGMEAWNDDGALVQIRVKGDKK